MQQKEPSDLRIITPGFSFHVECILMKILIILGINSQCAQAIEIVIVTVVICFLKLLHDVTFLYELDNF